VDVDASVNVVQHVPAIVVGIFVDDKIVAAIPTPVRADRPIPRGDFKVEATGQPEAVVVAIESLNAVAIRRTKVFEAAMFERMIDVKALIVRPVMAVPMVITDVRRGNNVAALAVFRFRLRARLAPRGEAPPECAPGSREGDSSRVRRGVARIPAELEKGSEQME
jgi:hypothetical protein